MNYLIFNLIFLLALIKKICFAIQLNGIVFAYIEELQYYTIFANKFNEYTRNNNIDINLHIELYTPNNSTSYVNDYGSTLEALLNKGSTKYDLIFYDTMYSPRYSNLLEDLRYWLPEEHISMYSSGIASQSCTYKGKWVGLPFYVSYSILYSNSKLLNKYGKEIPETWDELIETGSYILKNEIKNGNYDLIGYNGLFPEYETTLISAQEVIYSFRKTKDSPYPNYTDQEAIDALNKIKEVKDALASDSIFKSDESNCIIRLFNGNAIFLKFWYFDSANPVYNRTVLVGNKKGVSASNLGGTNVGINKNISNEKKEAAAKALEYVTSYDNQKYLIMNYKEFSGINSLYDDKEVCKVFDCILAKNIQPITRPSSLTNDYDEYSKIFINYFHKFLYGNKTAIEVLKKINDITNIYDVKINPSNSLNGFIIFIITSMIIVLMLLSLIFLFIDKYKKYFNIFSIDLWILIFIGFVISLSFIFMEYGKANILKCHFRYIFLSLGFTFIFCPILYKLIINFPYQNKNNIIFKWINKTKNKYIFLFLFSLYDIILNLLLIIPSFEIKDHAIKYGKNFQTCENENPFGITLFILFIVEKVFILIAIFILIFMEWNIYTSLLDIRLITTCMYITTLILIGCTIYNFIKAKDYNSHFIIPSLIDILYILSNYFFIYGIRLFLLKSENGKENRIISYFSSISTSINNNSSNVLCNNKNKDNGSKNIIISMLLSYHYYSGIENESNNESINANNFSISVQK